MDKAMEILDVLSKKLGVATDVLWEALLRQAFIEGMFGVTLFLISLVGVYIGIRTLIKYDYEDLDNFKWTTKDYQFVSYCLIGLACLISTCVCAIHLPIYLAGIFNPEYWALQEILKAF